MSKKLTQDQIQHIADLAKISLADEEKEKFQNALGSVLEYVDKLQQVDVSGVEPIAHITGLENKTRDDENGSTSSPQAGSSHADPKNLFNMAPETKDGYVKVNKVL